MTRFTVQQLATAIGGHAFGDVDLTLTGAAEPADAGPSELALAASPKFLTDLPKGQAKAALLSDGTDWQALGLEAAILVARPRFAFSGLSQAFDASWRRPSGVHATAFIDPTAQIGAGATIGAFTKIGAGVILGADAWIGSHVSISDNATIGETATIFDGVKIGRDVRIGARFVGQPGCVIGADGFSFVTPEPSAVESVRDTLGDAGETNQQSWQRIHSLGSVEVGDDVELGANSCIDRGTIRNTKIGNGCKFDNLAQVGHNVVIGNDCMICAQVGIAGSSRLGNNVVLGGQTGVSDNLFIGDNAITGGATKVLANVPAGRVMLGYPAMKMDQHLNIYKLMRKLPRLFADVSALKSEAQPPK